MQTQTQVPALARLRQEKPGATKIGDVTAKGRRFELWHDATETETLTLSGYYLVSPRGLVFTLCRNRPRPTMLFPIQLYDGTKVLDLWFRERAPGQLELPALEHAARLWPLQRAPEIARMLGLVGLHAYSAAWRLDADELTLWELMTSLAAERGRKRARKGGATT
jgi:hypothetical protein